MTYAPVASTSDTFQAVLMPKCGMCLLASSAGTRKHEKPLLCSGCHSVYYCSKKCQAEHWPTHKLACSRLSQSKSDHKRERRWLTQFFGKYYYAIALFHRWYIRKHDDHRTNPPVFWLRGGEIVHICPQREALDAAVANLRVVDDPRHVDVEKAVILLATMDDGRPVRIVPLEHPIELIRDLDVCVTGVESLISGSHGEVFNIFGSWFRSTEKAFADARKPSASTSTVRALQNAAPAAETFPTSSPRP